MYIAIIYALISIWSTGGMPHIGLRATNKRFHCEIRIYVLPSDTPTMAEVQHCIG